MPNMTQRLSILQGLDRHAWRGSLTAPVQTGSHRRCRKWYLAGVPSTAVCEATTASPPAVLGYTRWQEVHETAQGPAWCPAGAWQTRQENLNSTCTDWAKSAQVLSQIAPGGGAKHLQVVRLQLRHRQQGNFLTCPSFW